MAAPIRPLPRLKQLAAENGDTVVRLARVIGRSPTYLRSKLDRDTYLLDLRLPEIEKLARLYGVPASELGG